MSDGSKQELSVTEICALTDMRRNTFYSRIRDEGLNSDRFFRKAKYQRVEDKRSSKGRPRKNFDEREASADFKRYLQRKEDKRKEVADKRRQRDLQYQAALKKYARLERATIW